MNKNNITKFIGNYFFACVISTHIANWQFYGAQHVYTIDAMN